MSDYESRLVEKMIFMEIKQDVIHMLHALQFDGVYNIDHALKDLEKLALRLDDYEGDFGLILDARGTDRLKEVN
ncbi:hypothetical protein [Alkalibacillus aidingensis]|uniref:hypothetical protein n=1 Tax=Alkalibacillus aidingensis TaxID=2747607 RepID=UPI001660F098|nr:hypothetical protein [Alkalibacillus aidingensis]